MNKQHFFLNCVFLITVLFFTSCIEKGQGSRKSLLTDRPLIIDSANAAATDQQLNGYPPQVIDSVYSQLAMAMIRENKFALLQNHLDYYRKREGKNDKHKAALTALVNGYACNYTAKYDSAHHFFEQAIATYQTLNNKEGLAESYLGLAINETYLGNIEQSLANNFRSIELWKQLKDSANIYRVQIEIAIDHYYQKEYKRSTELLLTCQHYYEGEKNLKMIAEVESILSSCYYNLKDYPQSIANARSSLAIRRQLGEPRDIAESLNNLSLPLMDQELWNETAIILKESLALMEQAGDKRQLPIIRQNLANCLWKTGDFRQAEKLLNQAIEEAKQQGQKDAIVNAYKKLSTINKAEGKLDSALYFYKRYKAWNDTLFNEEKARAINELNIKYETDKKEQRIHQLSIEKELETTRKIAYLLAAVFIALMAAFTVLVLINRNRKNKWLVEKVKRELEANEKELASFTQSILAKNKFIEELEAKLRKTANASLYQQQEDEEVSELYQLKILTEDDWTQFKIRFDKVFPGFINKLRIQFPELTPAEERQFLLIKLNIDNKECANMLGISAESIKKNRYRLKKKCNLQEKDRLDDFVKNFN